jgi:uridylate kinase
MNADVLLKASKVDGIYDKDPATNSHARKLDELSYMDFISEELRVMDTTAVTMCKEHQVPIHVFDMTEPGNIIRAVRGDRIGTVVH